MSDLLNDIKKRASSSTIEQSKVRMDRIKNPPTYESGMEDTGGFSESDLNGLFSNSFESTEQKQQSIEHLLSPEYSTLLNLNNQQQQNVVKEKSSEDKFFDSLKEAWKLIKSGTKKFIQFCKNTDIHGWGGYLSRAIVGELIGAGVCLLLMLFQFKTFLFIIRLVDLLVLDIVFLGITVLSFTFIADHLKDKTGSTTGKKQQTQTDSDVSAFTQYESDGNSDYESEYFSTDLEAEETQYDTDFSNLDSYYTEQPEKGSKPATLSDSDLDSIIDVIKKGSLSDRGSMVELYRKALPKYNPDFDSETIIEEKDDLFHIINEYCTKAIHATMTKKVEEDEDTYLIEAYTTKIYIRAKMKRIKGVNNSEAIAKEVESYFKKNKNDPIYATVDLWGDNYDIKVFTREKFIISTGDILNHPEVIKYFNDSDNVFPVAIGIGDDGAPIIRDFKDLESFMITGIPRHGKTQTAVNCMTQLAMFNSPEDVQFIVLDPKNLISDFKYFKLPHMVSWCGELKYFLEVMRALVDKEGARRSKLFAQYDCVNIFEFREKNPDIQMPILYLVIDEVVTVAEKLAQQSQEAKKEFDRLTLELTTRLPSMGIRMIIIPHVAKHKFIDKTVTQNIPFKAAVCVEPEVIKTTLGWKTFKYQLTNKGDTALKIGTENVCYVKSAIVADTPETNRKTWDFIARVWEKKGYNIEESPALRYIYEFTP